jgi:hypothetical protein
MHTPSQSYFALLQVTLSVDRLAPYCQTSDQDSLDTAARYLWNMALCEALYPVLQAQEIALRNTLHDAISKQYGPMWFDRPGLLDAHAQNTVTSVRNDLAKEHKTITPGRIVAGLTFGFWTSLFNTKYERQLWQPLLRHRTPFPHAGRLRARNSLSARMNGIRRLRNRIFHHEPIWYRATLVQDHMDILEAIRWIDPVFERTIATIDRFPAVYQQGIPHYRALATAFCMREQLRP